MATSVASNATVTITEIMPSNIATTVSDKFDYNGYVEFYNDGEPIDLNGWFIKNRKEGKENWYFKLAKTHILPTGYSVMFFGKEETSSETAKAVHPLYVGSVQKKLTQLAKETRYPFRILHNTLMSLILKRATWSLLLEQKMEQHSKSQREWQNQNSEEPHQDL